MTKPRKISWPTAQAVTDAVLAGQPPPSVKDQLGKRRLGPFTEGEAKILRMAFEINPTLMLPIKTLAREIAKRTGGDAAGIRTSLQRILKTELPPLNPHLGGGLLGIKPVPLTRAQRLTLWLSAVDNL